MGTGSEGYYMHNAINWSVELYPPWKNRGVVHKFLQKQTDEQQALILRNLEELEEEVAEHGLHKLFEARHLKRIRSSRQHVCELVIRGKPGYRCFLIRIRRTIVVVHIVKKKDFSTDAIKTADKRASDVKAYYSGK